MPGTFKTYYVLAFDLDEGAHPIRAFEPRRAAAEAAAIEEARDLAAQHAGAVAWKREGKPAIGEEGEPEILYWSGRIGDFA